MATKKKAAKKAATKKAAPKSAGMKRPPKQANPTGSAELQAWERGIGFDAGQ